MRQLHAKLGGMAFDGGLHTVVAKLAPVVPDPFVSRWDTYSLPRAYSLYKFKTTQTLCIRVRRSSDNTEQDIGFSAVNHYVDTAALLAFVGSGDGFITTWYDPAARGGTYNATCTTAADQPYIVIAGVLCVASSKPTARANGRACWFTCAAIDTRTTNHMGLGFVGSGVAAASSKQIPVAHRSDRNLNYGRLVMYLDAPISGTPVMGFDRAIDTGDATSNHPYSHADNKLLAAWLLAHNWTTGGGLYKNNVTTPKVSSGSVAYYTAVANGGRNTAASYYPVMGDPQAVGNKWYGDFSECFYTIAAIDYAGINASQKTIWGIP